MSQSAGRMTASATDTAGSDAFSPGAFAARAERRLLARVPAEVLMGASLPGHGDHVGAPCEDAPGVPPSALPQAHRLAAVLVPIIARPDATVLFTRRARHLRDHSGQIAFPGGKIEPGDADPTAAALREAREEIGLEAALIRPLGHLDVYLSSTGFRIVPVVALVDPNFSLSLDPHEVEAAFEVPLRFLMAPENHQRHAREWQGSIRRFYAIPYGDHFIWGVTAGILRNLFERVYG